ncbi:MAG: hypothetical protein ACI9U2_002245 [Bradymonadia bacterium]|jgi:hypothetical protein
MFMRLSVVLGLIVALTSAAHAGKEKAPAPKKGVSAILKMLDWGASSVAVFEALEDEIDARFADKIKYADTLVVDKVMRRRRAEKKAIRKAYVRFDGRASGYEASLVADDFSANNGEAMVRVDDGPAQRYYFFKDEQLYKVLVVYSTAVARQTKFAPFVSKAAGKYGKPAKTITDKTPDKALIGAIWRDDLTELRVRDRSLFGTYTMAFLQAGRGSQIEDARSPSAEGASPIVDAQADGMIEDFMVESRGDRGNVVDRLTGVEHKVNLNLGRQDSQPLRRAPEPRRDTRSAEKAAQKAAKKAAKKKSAPKEADFSPTPTGPDDIVY